MNDKITDIMARLPSGGRLVASSKTRTAEEVEAAYEAGIKHFGENYVQEGGAKAEAVSSVTWHLIGPLQSNKVNKAMAVFDVFHTVDREKLLNKLDTAAAELGKTPEVFLQVNVGREPQKAGVMPEDLSALVSAAGGCKNLKLVGLMTIPPAGVNMSAPDPTVFFTQLRRMAEEFNLPRLSMGMSGDWQTALNHGATDIRLGTALFGERG